MRNVLKTLSTLVLGGLFVFSAGPAHAADTDVFAKILKKVDDLVCTRPQQIAAYYHPKLVIMSDDRRVLLEHRIKDYELMIGTMQDMKCKFNRTVLSGNAGQKVGYLLVDELISVSSRLSTDERQHSVCTYAFTKEKSNWRITHEHCSSLPDYSIVPGDDALYYFHNPVY